MPLKPIRLLLLIGAVILAASVALAWADQKVDQKYEETTFVPVDHPAINYNEGPINDSMTRLTKKLDSGQAKLEPLGRGAGVLAEPSEESGHQRGFGDAGLFKDQHPSGKISPRNPRELFFKDDVIVGNVRGGEMLEMAALDPKQGYIFYTLDVQKSDQPTIVRRDSCLQCHQGPATLGIPGIMVGSVYPDSSGMPASRMGNPVTDDRTPIEERWGGWYVSGTHGGMHHKGNAVARDQAHPDLLETQGTQNLTSLAKKFDATGYMSGVSDIVALMTLEHQTRMTNLMTRVSWDQRIAEQEGKRTIRRAAHIDSELESW